MDRQSSGVSLRDDLLIYRKKFLETMNPRGDIVSRVINAIDWRKIKGYHKKLGIFWEVEHDKEIIKRLPTVAELKSELRSLIEHVLDEDLPYISHGSWVIFFDNEGGGLGDIRVIFRLADFHFEENKESIENLRVALDRAVETEDYEKAALIRDAILKYEKNQALSGQ